MEGCTYNLPLKITPLPNFYFYFLGPGGARSPSTPLASPVGGYCGIRPGTVFSCRRPILSQLNWITIKNKLCTFLCITLEVPINAARQYGGLSTNQPAARTKERAHYYGKQWTPAWPADARTLCAINSVNSAWSRYIVAWDEVIAVTRSLFTTLLGYTDPVRMPGLSAPHNCNKTKIKVK